MPLTAPAQQKTNYEPVPTGNHVARLYEIVLLGTIPGEWKGEPREYLKIRLTFELCNKRKEFKEGEGEKPYSLSRTFTFSMAEKSNLRPFVEGIIGAKLKEHEAVAFDIETLLGAACLLNVVHVERNDVTYANIQGASPLPEGIEAPEMFNTPRLIDVNTTPLDELTALPTFLFEKISKSREYQRRARVASGMEEPTRKEGFSVDASTPVDDIPF